MIEHSVITLLPEVRRIAIEAGEKIMQVFSQGFDIEIKSDDSPVTTADLIANEFIKSELNKLDSKFPILSEESAIAPFAERSSRQTYWLVDPLDGTRDFIKRLDSFSVNIALIHQNHSVLGVVYAPAQGLSYYAAKGQGSFKQIRNEITPIKARKLIKDKAVIATSSVHTGKMTSAFLENYEAEHGHYDIISMGSSLKMCMVAEGRADLYPRLWLTSEWDTAAAHCIVDEAGGKLVKIDMSPLLYNTKDSLLNPFFFAVGNNQIEWDKYLPDEVIGK